MKLRIELSTSLKSIYSQLPGVISLELQDEAITLAEALKLAGIQPLLVIKGVVDGGFIALDQVIEHDCSIKLLSPISGG